MLLADTDKESASALCRAAQASASISLRYASSLGAADALLEEQQWDLLAVGPVEAADLDFLQRLKTTHPWIATLVVLRSATPQLLCSAMTSKPDWLLLKPVSPAEFLAHALRLAEEANDRRKREQRRVLAIGAHPDDVEIGCGGTLARHRAHGDIVHIVTLSRGAAGGDINVRSLEAQRAAQIIGASLKLGNMPDGHISDGVETIRIIEDAIRDLGPTHVYTHSLEDTHQDHRAAHAASLVAARAVPNIYCYQSPSSTVTFQPHHFVDMGDFMKIKLQAIAAYKSQAERVLALHPDNVVAEARHWGRYARYVLAEPFRIFRQIDHDARDRGQRGDDVVGSLPEPAPAQCAPLAAAAG